MYEMDVFVQSEYFIGARTRAGPNAGDNFLRHRCNSFLDMLSFIE